MKNFAILILSLLISAASFAQIQTINIGTSANDRTGDPIRTAFEKVNDNFEYLETAIEGAGTESPTFTGIPTAPTAALGTNTTQIATTAFVQATIDDQALDYTPVPDTRTVAGVDLVDDITAAELASAISFSKQVCVNSGVTLVVLSNMPSTPTTLNGLGAFYRRTQTTNMSAVRLMAWVQAGSASVNSPRLYLQYFDGGSYVTVGAGTVASGDAISLATGGVFVISNWITLPAGAKGDFLWRVVSDGGDGAADPSVGSLDIEFRSN